RTLRCRASDISVTSHRLGRNVRLDLFSAWLRNCPDMGNLPDNSHRRVIGKTPRRRPSRDFGAYRRSRAVLYERRKTSSAVPIRTGRHRIVYSSGAKMAETHN